MKPIKYTWPTPDPDAICLEADYVAGVLPINGALFNANNSSGSPVVFDGISRTVSITSDEDLSLVTFTIRGLYNGAVVSEEFLGPDNDTVETEREFDAVLSVSVDVDVDSVSVGSGTKGHTKWFSYDYNRSLSEFSVQVIVTGTINYSFGATLEDVSTTDTIDNNTLADITGTMSAQTTSDYVSSRTPFRYGTVEINSSGADGALVVYMCQVGIT